LNPWPFCSLFCNVPGNKDGPKIFEPKDTHTHTEFCSRKAIDSRFNGLQVGSYHFNGMTWFLRKVFVTLCDFAPSKREEETRAKNKLTKAN
jgi:hypothetical protein